MHTHTHTVLAHLHHVFTPSLEKQEHCAHENICFPFVHPLQHKTKAFFMSEHEGCVLRLLGNSAPVGELERYATTWKTNLWVTPFVTVRVTERQPTIKRVCGVFLNACMCVYTLIFVTGSRVFHFLDRKWYLATRWKHRKCTLRSAHSSIVSVCRDPHTYTLICKPHNKSRHT